VHNDIVEINGQIGYNRVSIMKKKNDDLLERFAAAVAKFRAGNPGIRLSANRMAREIGDQSDIYVADVTVRSWLAGIRVPTGMYREALEKYVKSLASR